VLAALEQHFGSADALRECERALQQMLRARGVLFGDGLLPTYAHVFLAQRDHLERWAQQAEELVEAAEVAAKLLVADPSFFHSMGLPDHAVELVRVDPGYSRICVVCRPDGLPVGTDMKFVEINSDSPAMMMFIDLVAQCLLELPGFEWLRAHPRPPSAADHLLDTLVACYREQGGTRQPNIAITDWDGQKTRFEHQRLAEHFEARGFATIVCDPRAFRRIDGELCVDGRRIDLVYRRALAAEVIARQDEIEPLLRAYRDGTICMVNPLRSYAVGVKSLLSYLVNHGGGHVVPRTILLDTPQARAFVEAAPSRWVLKKSESHGGGDVILPEPANRAAWRAALHDAATDTWIAQEYLEVPKLKLPVVDGDRVIEVDKHYNWNPFIFGGKYAGGLVRLSSTPLINITLGGGLLPTFVK
jgi:Glutathionylspermidine synthase preATP-grasp